MARLSTGQSYGDTNRSTSAQLLGGIPTEASPGAIAQASINEPTLQPQARPVSTFQQVGAPTLGGNVRMFQPPDLPTPSRDLASLAAALGNLSPALANLGQSYVEVQKIKDTKAQAVGQSAALQLQQMAPGQNFIQARDMFYRLAQQGDAGAAAAYQQMQALSPLQQAYAQRYTGQAALREDIGTAVERFKAVTEIGGVPINQIPPGDPRLSGLKSSLYRLPVNDPVGFAEMMPLIAAKNGEIDRIHMGMHLERKVNEASSAGQASLTSHFMGSDVDVPRIVAYESQRLTSVRKDLGIEEYQKITSNYGDSLASAVLAGSLGNDGKVNVQRYHNLMGKAIDVFTQVQAGPNGELLLTTLGAKGGTAAQLALTQKMMSQLKTFNESVTSFNGAIGEEKGVDILKITKADDPSLSPAQRETAYTQSYLMANQLPEDQRLGAIEKITKSKTQTTTFLVEPLQRQVERQALFDYSLDPATEIRKYEQLKVSGLMDPRAADRLIGQYRQLQSADMQPYRAAGAKAIKDAMTQEIAAMKLPGSDGDAVITQKEQTYLLNRQAQLSTGLETIRRQSMADGTGPVGFSEKIQVWSQSLKSQAPKPPNPLMTPLMPKGPEVWKQSLGFFGQMGPGNSATNYTYKQRVDNGLVMDPKEFIKNYDDYVENGRLSDGLKLFIRRSGYGSNPSQFFFKQWNKAYPGVKMNQDSIDTLKALDQQKISFAQPPAAANPYAQTAMNIQSMIRNASMGAMNAFVPPAAASEMPMAVTGPTLPASTTLLTVIDKLRGSTSFRGTSQLKYKQAGDYQSHSRENFFFDFNPALVSRAQARARSLSEQDINALTFTALTESGPTRLGKLEVAANLINRSAANKNIPIVSVAKAPGQYEGVFNYKPSQLINASEGRRIFGSAYDQVRNLITRGR
jgi:hypothetical protein